MSGLFQHDPAKLREELAGEVPPTSSGCLGGCLGIVLLGTGLAFALRGAYRLLIATFTTVQTDPKGWVALILITAAIVAAGAVLYYVKVKLHTGYGLMETTFGVATAWGAALNLSKNGFAASLGAIAAAYLIVKGIEDTRAGLDKGTRPSKPPAPATASGGPGAQGAA